MKKINIAILFGGKSGEHEVSLISAKNIISALDKKKYNPILIGIDKNGVWHLQDKANFLLNENNPKLVALNKSNVESSMLPYNKDKNLISIKNNTMDLTTIDLVLPVLHGPFGEDGTIQGLLELCDVPYVGSGVIGSACGMDKEIMKRLLRDGGIEIGKFLSVTKYEFEKNKLSFEEVENELGLPFFIKPANLGSSVGISKIHKKEEFKAGLEEAFKFDKKIVIEETINGREIECAILGNDETRASIPGEIKPRHDFYSYEAKYIDDNGAELIIPAPLTEKQVKDVQDLSKKVFRLVYARGLARVDFFLTPEGKFICNEINTFPGFTKISMYPSLWKASGMPYSELLNELIELAIEEHQSKKKLI